MTTVPNVLSEGDLTLEPTNEPGTGVGEFVGFAITLAGERIGSLALRHEDRQVLSVRWNVGEHAMQTALRVLRLAVPHGFSAWGATRIEARIPIERTDDIRAASIVGMRREGIIRGAGDQPDRVLMARLADDPPITDRNGFIAILNAGLPTKRVISQGILRDEAGRVLLCELTYKSEWDLPGGVIEVGESPAEGLVRELHEELGIEVEIRGLITVNWLPAWRGWDDACVFVFDLGTVDSSTVDTMTLQATEIKDVHWCDPATVAERATAATIDLLTTINDGQVPPYREAPQSPE